MDTEPPPAESTSGSFDLLDERIQRWIWAQKWQELHDVQERAIPRILAADRDVILAAATAGGKTEAAFLPILTNLVRRSGADGLVIYISPLKALINDQWRRLEGLCETLDIPVYPWHGDVSAKRKRQFFKNPAGVVLITPESLESLFMNYGHGLRAAIKNLVYVVVDELHAFMGTERGKQLQSLLHRLEIASGRVCPRIGLSATLGDMELASDYLRPGAGDLANVIVSREDRQELKLIIKGFLKAAPEHSSDASDTPGAVVAVGAELAVSADIFQALRGSNNLIFPNSRRNVELYADLLRRKCDDLGVPNEFWPHHGNLSKELREETEEALKKGDRPATAVCTTTLELGIDIGSVRSVAQIGSPPSVASLRQRLGRSGRRGEAAILRSYCIENVLDSKSPVSDQLREGLVQTMALVRLLLDRWYEPPNANGLHLSTLVQQLLSLISQYGGVTATRAWEILCAGGPFRALSQSQFVELLRALGASEILMRSGDGLLLHGAVGEKLVNHYSFYAAFTSEKEYRVESQGHTLGTVPISHPLAEGSYIIFAGRRWSVVSVDDQHAIISVMPSPAGRPPEFGGNAGSVHTRVRERMYEIYQDTNIEVALDMTARELLAEARRHFDRLDLGERRIVKLGANTYIFAWQGDVIGSTMALLLSRKHLRAQSEGLSIVVYGSTEETVKSSLSAIAHEPIPSGEELAASIKNKLHEKWDGLLPENLLSLDYASSALDVIGAQRACAALC